MRKINKITTGAGFNPIFEHSLTHRKKLRGHVRITVGRLYLIILLSKLTKNLFLDIYAYIFVYNEERRYKIVRCMSHKTNINSKYIMSANQYIFITF